MHWVGKHVFQLLWWEHEVQSRSPCDAVCVGGRGQWWWLELSVHLDTPPSPSLQPSQEDLCPSSLPGAIGGMGRPGWGVTPSTKSFLAQTLGVILSCFHPHNQPFLWVWVLPVKCFLEAALLSTLTDTALALVLIFSHLEYCSSLLIGLLTPVCCTWLHNATRVIFFPRNHVKNFFYILKMFVMHICGSKFNDTKEHGVKSKSWSTPVL